MTVFFVIGSVVIYVFNFISVYGKSVRSYNSQVQKWQQGNIGSLFNNVDFAFKILPYVDSARNRDMYIMEHATVAK